MGNKLTTMQILRGKLQEKLDKESVKVEMFSKVHYQKGVTEALQGVINIINTEMLQIEREQIENIFKDAQVLHALNDSTRAEQYFTQTYETE